MNTLLKFVSVAGMATSLAACGGGSGNMAADMAADPATRASGAPVSGTPAAGQSAGSTTSSGTQAGGQTAAQTPSRTSPPAGVNFGNGAPPAANGPVSEVNIIPTTKTSRDGNNGIRVDNRTS